MMPIWMSALTAAVSVVMLIREGRRYALGNASLRWRRVDGTIVDLWFDVKDKRTMDGDPYISTSAHVVYNYVVNGRRYRGKHFTYRPTRGLGERDAYALLSGLRSGHPVEVYYDPKRPQRAVVLPGTDNGNRFRVGGWGVLVLVSLGYAAATGFAG